MTMASGLYGVTLQDILDASQLAVNTAADSFKFALVTDTHTPNFDTHDFYADITNEISGTGYTATGNVLDSVTCSSASGFLTFDAADEAWTTATFSAVRGGILYDDTLASDPLIMAVTFGSDFAVTAGTFTIQWSASGIWRIDYIP